MKPIAAVLSAGALVSLVAAQSIGTFGGGSPTIASPAPLLLIVPAFLGLPKPSVALLFGAVFLSWIPSLYTGGMVLPRRSTALGGLVTMLSAAAYAIGWNYGVQYQGLPYTLTCLVLSLLLAACCLAALWHARKAASFRSTLLAHTLTFVWLASYAFPYFGEVP